MNGKKGKSGSAVNSFALMGGKLLPRASPHIMSPKWKRKQPIVVWLGAGRARDLGEAEYMLHNYF
jgi:hypothetical protein